MLHVHHVGMIVIQKAVLLRRHIISYILKISLLKTNHMVGKPLKVSKVLQIILKNGYTESVVDISFSGSNIHAKGSCCRIFRKSR